MFKGFQNTSRSHGFNGFPALNFQMNNEAYGFSGCTFWLDAAYGLNTQTDLAAVSSWQSRIGNVTFTQATAGNQPRFILSDANFNNKPTIDFSVGSRTLVNANGPSITGQSRTLAFIARATNIGKTYNIFLINTAANTDIDLGAATAGITGIGVYTSINLNVPSLVTTIENTSTHIVVITPTEIIVDGVSQVSGSVTSFDLNNIGFANVNGFTGLVAEIFVYNFGMTSSQAITLCNNINSKYAIY